MRSKKKLSKTHKIIKKIIVSVLSLAIAVVVFFELTVRDRLEYVIIAEIKTLAHTAINNAVKDYINKNNSICDELVEFSSGDSSEITSITENIYAVNTFKAEISNMAQSYIDSMMLVDGINVKLGNFTGLTILSNVGPYIHFNIDSTPSVSCEILSSFKSAGVNQTMHHIELEVYVDIYVGNPFRIESIKFGTSYEISQTIIVGSVPSAYGTISRY